ncbi:hypothetical protein [Brevifollis gellanilyticus]|nr:hypothetical protein [Brevifollis gellanilyticus]
MRGRIESGDLVTLAPVEARDVRVDDVVLVAWKGNHLLHVVREIRDNEFLIGNNVGKINGWARVQDIRGRVVDVVHDAST